MNNVNITSLMVIVKTRGSTMTEELKYFRKNFHEKLKEYEYNQEIENMLYLQSCVSIKENDKMTTWIDISYLD